MISISSNGRIAIFPTPAFWACRERGIVIHSDATQLVPQGCFAFERLGVDLLTLSAHKFRGPRGVGLLIRAPGVELSPLQGGGGQEHGLRSGTEPVALVSGMAEALMALPSFDPVSQPVPPGSSTLIRRQRDQLLERLLELPQLQLCGPSPDQRLPCLLYTSPSPRDMRRSRMPSSA